MFNWSYGKDFQTKIFIETVGTPTSVPKEDTTSQEAGLTRFQLEKAHSEDFQFSTKAL